MPGSGQFGFHSIQEAVLVLCSQTLHSYAMLDLSSLFFCGSVLLRERRREMDGCVQCFSAYILRGEELKRQPMRAADQEVFGVSDSCVQSFSADILRGKELKREPMRAAILE